MSDLSPSPKRKRGIVLSLQGWQRLQAAEQRSAIKDNAGKPYTLEQLSQRTELSINTLTKVRRRQAAVDRQTLELYFKAFGLLLNQEDYTAIPFDALATGQRGPLEGQVPLNSPFYIYRPPAEVQGCEAILQPGSLIRIKAPRQYGKTSLMTRILAEGAKHRFRAVVLSLQLADATVLTDLNRFLRWFSAVVTRSLGLENHLEQYWDELFGASYNCTDYFERYTLPAANSELILALDEADIIFNYPEIASDFFGMLRAWYEKAKYGSIESKVWQRLHLVVVHSTEIYLPLNLNQSPFNVGVLLELPGFSFEQTQDLAQRYDLVDIKVDIKDCVTQLIQLVGGHPYLTQLALHHLSQQSITLEHLLQTAIEPNSIFYTHLRKQLGNLQAHPDLLAAMQQVILAADPIKLDPNQAFKLQSTGLIRLQPYAMASCLLYQQYFAQVFSSAC